METEAIVIPSPTAFLQNSPVLKASPAPPAPTPAPRPHRKSNTTKQKDGNVKPKQSKSRNGCVTCKAKRLKCDESKPTCQQCKKRSVVCGGYKKDFKWRPFEETTFKPGGPKIKRNSIVLDKPPDPVPVESPTASEADSATTGADIEDVPMEQSFFNSAVASPPPFTNSMSDFQMDQPSIFSSSTPPYMRGQPKPRIDPDHVTSSLNSLFDDANNILMPSTSPSPRPSFSGQSPRLIDLLMPGSELNARPGSVVLPPMSLPASSYDSSTISLSPLAQHFGVDSGLHQDSTLDEDIEEIIRSPQLSREESWMSSRGSSSNFRPRSLSMSLDDSSNIIFRQPEVQAGSPEMLMLRFDKQTCGILSVKDGPTENGWRTLVWPLARDSPALYHAIASMTAFHTAKVTPALRVDGMEHMRHSIRSLATGIEKMRTDTALATTLVLAFSESWDQHVSTGIEHLRGAKILVKRALDSHEKHRLRGDDLARLKFLCNTWVYMDVIARLTSVDDDEAFDSGHDEALWPFTASFSHSSPMTTNTELDPLMGCAASLFPLIGRVANLCRRVRKVPTNSIAIISLANELKEAITSWQPPPISAFDIPEDPTSEIAHALQTAEAYRYATLLYLHQAVPEIPSLSAAQLAKKVLVKLATVPLSSRLVIVQIYPLLAAGCEAWDIEDRQWVEARWNAMAARMWIGNIDRCLEVQIEVWKRRDQAAAAKAARESRRRPGQDMGPVHSASSQRKFEAELAMEDECSFGDMLAGSGVITAPDSRARARADAGFAASQRARRGRSEMEGEEDMDEELTVRGRLHWVGVMKDWGWEILLG